MKTIIRDLFVAATEFFRACDMYVPHLTFDFYYFTNFLRDLVFIASYGMPNSVIAPLENLQNCAKNLQMKIDLPCSKDITISKEIHTIKGILTNIEGLFNYRIR